VENKKIKTRMLHRDRWKVTCIFFDGDGTCYYINNHSSI